MAKLDELENLVQKILFDMSQTLTYRGDGVPLRVSGAKSGTTPKTHSAYVVAEYTPGTGDSLGVSKDSTWKYEGYLFINVYSPKNRGPADAMEVVSQVAEALSRRYRKDGKVTVEMGAVQTQRPVKAGNHMVTSLSIDVTGLVAP